jgi:hypothetical protein
MREAVLSLLFTAEMFRAVNHRKESPGEIYPHKDKNKIKIFLIYKEIQRGAVTKSFMRKSFLYI